jgi:hypothetical protein
LSEKKIMTGSISPPWTLNDPITKLHCEQGYILAVHTLLLSSGSSYRWFWNPSLIQKPREVSKDKFKPDTNFIQFLLLSAMIWFCCPVMTIIFM